MQLAHIQALSRSLLATLCLAVLPAPCFAQAAFVDEFTGSPGAIDGVGGGTGFSGNYSGGGTVVSPGLTYPGLQVAGNAFQLDTNAAFRDLATPIDTDTGTVYIGFLMALTPGTPRDFAGFSLYSDGQDHEEIFMGKPYLAENYGFHILDASLLPDSSAAPITTTPSLLVYRLTFSPSGDRIDFFSNPVPGSDLPPTPTLTLDMSEDTLDTFSSIRLQSGFLDGAAAFQFDELRIGGSFADVAPAVPEPAALGLLGFAALLVRRRRPMKNPCACLWCAALAGVTAVVAFASPPASAASVTVYSGPTYDSVTDTGFRYSFLAHKFGRPVGNGAAVGWAYTYAAGADAGTRAMRFGPGGAFELGNLGTGSDGSTYTQAYAINASGNSVGYATKYVGATNKGWRAVRWDPVGAVTELGNIGTNSSGGTNAEAYAINATGTSVGYAYKYAGDTWQGSRAVRWSSSGVAAELGNLGTKTNGEASSVGYAVNAAGSAVGGAGKYSGNLTLGTVAVRWDGAGTTATELNAFPGFYDSFAYDINASGAAVGYSHKRLPDNGDAGLRAVRWDAGGTTFTELANIGLGAFGEGYSEAYHINDAGFACGIAYKPGPGEGGGNRPVRWDAAGNVTELGILGTDSTGHTDGVAFDINAGGTTVGSASKYTANGTFIGPRALLWRADGSMIDLNSLLSPADANFWTFFDARGISDTNWVGGSAEYDPDGAAGPKPSYSRGYLIDASSVVPEPGSIGLLASGGVTLLRRRTGRRAINVSRAKGRVDSCDRTGA
jgi:MYXO-CTERM domain-containing protein